MANLRNFLKRRKRTRSKIEARKVYPRLSVFRSNKYIYAQIIDDNKGTTLVGASDKEINVSDEKKAILKMQNKTERARLVGQTLAKKALKKKIEKVVFDRGGYQYHGRVRELAEGAREGGLKF